MNILGTTYEIATHSNLKKKYFIEQLKTKNIPKVTGEMLKKIDNNVTLFGTTIKIGDILLMGLIISNVITDKLEYNFFYCTKNELRKLGSGKYLISGPTEGIPKIIPKNLITNIKNKMEK